jgi:hypothetical protein
VLERLGPRGQGGELPLERVESVGAGGGLAARYADRASRRSTPGAVCAVLASLLVSLAFSLYVSHFGSYNKTGGVSI